MILRIISIKDIYLASSVNNLFEYSITKQWNLFKYTIVISGIIVIIVTTKKKKAHEFRLLTLSYLTHFRPHFINFLTPRTRKIIYNIS